MEHFGPLGVLIFIIISIIQAVLRKRSSAQLENENNTREQTAAERDLQATLQRKLEEARARARQQSLPARTPQAGMPQNAGGAPNWSRPALEQERQLRRSATPQMPSAPPPPVPDAYSVPTQPAPQPRALSSAVPPPRTPAYEVAKDARE